MEVRVYYVIIQFLLELPNWDLWKGFPLFVEFVIGDFNVYSAISNDDVWRAFDAYQPLIIGGERTDQPCWISRGTSMLYYSNFLVVVAWGNLSL